MDNNNKCVEMSSDEEDTPSMEEKKKGAERPASPPTASSGHDHDTPAQHRKPSRKSPKHSKASGGAGVGGGKAEQQQQQEGAREATPEERSQQQQQQQQDPSTDASETADVLWLTLKTKLNQMRLNNPQKYEKYVEKMRSAIYHSDVDDSAESSSDDEYSGGACTQEMTTSLPPGGETSGGGSGGSGGSPTVTPSTGGGGGGGKKFIKMVDRLAESKFFQAATDNRYIKKAMEGVSTEIKLTVELKSLSGTVVLNMPPPPSDRIWVGFRPLPEILLSARPVVGERNISYFMVTSWIEKKLLQEFQKILVVPNMEDFIIPVMNPKLPD